MARRISLSFSLVLVALGAALIGSARAAAAIGPPWCGTPSPDATAALPDGSGPNDPVGSYPHIPWYAVGCTLDGIIIVFALVRLRLPVVTRWEKWNKIARTLGAPRRPRVCPVCQGPRNVEGRA